MRAFLAFIVAASAVLAIPAHAETWKTYVNGRYGTTAEYPAERFRALPAPVNGDGLAFEGTDGSKLAISGGFNAEDFTPDSFEKFLHGAGERDFGNTTYRMIGKHSLVLSGLRGNQIFYEKYIFTGDVIHSLAISYPRSAKAQYDPIVDRIARSFGPR